MKIKAHTKLVLRRIVLGLVIVFVLSAVVLYMVGDYLIIRGFVFFGGHDIEDKQIRLLYKTDHQALLAACRELSKQVTKGELKAGTYWVRGNNRSPEASQFPQPILDLKPNYVYIDENDCGRVMLEMFGGFTHFGVLAYTEDYKKPTWAEYGDKELIPGLWYYDD
ncbi:MAG: hypothetical protein ABIF19_01765 [Planctomycetota bacterium]